MVDPRLKGSRAESKACSVLKDKTGLAFNKTPKSGALDPVHGLKGDIYVPKAVNIYSIEVKHYKEDHITSKLITSKDPQVLIFWKQAVRQAKQCDQKPLLIFKFDRSKFFVAMQEQPSTRYIYCNYEDYAFYISELLSWLTTDKPEFIK